MDNLSTLSVEEITALQTEKRNAFDALIALDAPTTAQVDEAGALADDLDAIDAEMSRRATAADRFAALKNKKFASDEEKQGGEREVANKENPERAEHEETVQESPGEVVAPGEEAPAEGEGETETQSRGKVAALAAKTQRPSTARRQAPVLITAAADVPEFSTGQHLDSLSQVAEAVINRARGFAPPSGDGSSVSIQKFGTAMFNLDIPEDLTIDRHTGDHMEVINRAASERNLEGGSLVAAGGWCAPSETLYDLDDDATTEGMLSLPEVGIKRGGLRYAVSPTFADFYANPGFMQTEAEAIAGTQKPCIEVDCPDFTEVRMDVEGVCIKVPILTNVGYPEYVRNFVSQTMTAHQHWINANVIGRLVADAGAARVFTGLGSTYSDTLEALGLVIDQTRQRYRLSFRATVEVVLPFWVKNAIRSDLARRSGRNSLAVSEQEITSAFAQVGANPQFVYDWQLLPDVDDAATTGVNERNTYPGSFNALVYPAGTYVKGTAPVINLNTVYDAASLQENVYTGLFTEQGFLVAKRKFAGELLTLPVCNAGRMGALDQTC